MENYPHNDDRPGNENSKKDDLMFPKIVRRSAAQENQSDQDPSAETRQSGFEEIINIEHDTPPAFYTQSGESDLQGRTDDSVFSQLDVKDALINPARKEDDSKDTRGTSD